MTLIGVQSFVIVMAIEAVYKMILAISKEQFDLDICHDAGPIGKTFCRFKRWQDGASFVVSSQALYNIIAFEEGLHRCRGVPTPKTN